MSHSSSSSAVPFPGLTKRLSEGWRKAFPAPLSQPLHGNVGAESGSSSQGMGKNGGFVKGMLGTKGCIYREVCAGSSTLSLKMLPWEPSSFRLVHKGTHSRSREDTEASQSDFIHYPELSRIFLKSQLNSPQAQSHILYPPSFENSSFHPKPNPTLFWVFWRLVMATLSLFVCRGSGVRKLNFEHIRCITWSNTVAHSKNSLKSLHSIMVCGAFSTPNTGKV